MWCGEHMLRQSICDYPMDFQPDNLVMSNATDAKLRKKCCGFTKGFCCAHRNMIKLMYIHCFVRILIEWLKWWLFLSNINYYHKLLSVGTRFWFHQNYWYDCLTKIIKWILDSNANNCQCGYDNITSATHLGCDMRRETTHCMINENVFWKLLYSILDNSELWNLSLKMHFFCSKCNICLWSQSDRSITGYRACGLIIDHNCTFHFRNFYHRAEFQNIFFWRKNKFI